MADARLPHESPPLLASGDAPDREGQAALERRFAPFVARMHAEALDPVLIETFKYHYRQLLRGDTGLIGEDRIRRVESLPDMEHLEGTEAIGREALSRTVVLKLNGGLGTSMGLEKAKSLLPVRGDLTFLDVIARQVLHLREQTGHGIPLVFMNSFSTEADTLAALERYPELCSGVPLTFIQNKVPKILQESFGPASWPDDPDLEWCPPGHGDMYTALETSGLLVRLLDLGHEYLFVSNADNLGAVLDERILGHFVREGLGFLMEVADRTPADSKGGHLARYPDGRLLLREVAQCPPEDMPSFGDIEKHCYFNTNNIWIHLPTLLETLQRHEGVIELPLIRNSKTLDPRQPGSPRVYQLETAMGAAIEVFPRAQGLRVPRTRFAPVKLCSDLLVLWSDAYQLTPEFHVRPNPENRHGMPVAKLEPEAYRFVDQLRSRFPEGAPSLREARVFEVQGDVRFGRGVVVRDDAVVRHEGEGQGRVPDGGILSGIVVV